jgi:diguanylate cyclase (GGDEF)-like protein
MHALAQSPAQTDELIEVPSWQSQLGILKAQLTSTLGEGGPELTSQMWRQLNDCSSGLDRLHAILEQQFERRETQQSRWSSLQLKAMRAQRLADVDCLTSLPNRRYFLRKLARAVSVARPRGRALAVMFLDIDDFKQVNDLHGHDTGDKLLRIVARRLTHCMRSDDLVSRLGGDEFACMLTGDGHRGEVGQIAAKLLEALSSPATIGSLRLSARPSIGIALFPDDGTNGANLLRRADAAMYHAKRQRSGFSFFDAAAMAGCE